jgi:hypothetical protein
MKEAEVANPGRPGNSTAGLFLPSGNSPTAFITAGGSHGRPVSLPGGFPSGFFALPGRITPGFFHCRSVFPGRNGGGPPDVYIVGAVKSFLLRMTGKVLTKRRNVILSFSAVFDF